MFFFIPTLPIIYLVICSNKCVYVIYLHVLQKFKFFNFLIKIKILILIKLNLFFMKCNQVLYASVCYHILKFLLTYNLRIFSIANKCLF